MGNSKGLVACAPRRRRRYSPYVGEVYVAPGNTCLDERGRHRFAASQTGCGSQASRNSASPPASAPLAGDQLLQRNARRLVHRTPPNAVLANSSLLRACSQLAYGEHHWVHSDRGSHYRWPGWIAICDGHGIVRSMTRKGCSPDNSRAEGFFGRLKVESFHGRGWDDAGMGEFMEMPDAYLFWYRDKRRKSDLGYMSPMQFRRSLGPVA